MTATPFSYINDASVDLNEVCLHITYLFLKELVLVSNVFLLALLSHENLHSLPEVVSRVFSPQRSDSSDPRYLATFGGRYFRGVVTFGEQRSFTNRAGVSLFSDGIDGLPDYRMGESADIRGDRVLH